MRTLDDRPYHAERRSGSAIRDAVHRDRIALVDPAAIDGVERSRRVVGERGARRRVVRRLPAPDDARHEASRIAATVLIEQSGRRDSNSRLLAPKASALPGCATSRAPQCRDVVRCATITTSRRGPWTPSTRFSSMSLVADGPETSTIGRPRARARLERCDQLRHRLHDLPRRGRCRRAGRGRG